MQNHAMRLVFVACPVQACSLFRAASLSPVALLSSTLSGFCVRRSAPVLWMESPVSLDAADAAAACMKQTRRAGCVQLVAAVQH